MRAREKPLRLGLLCFGAALAAASPARAQAPASPPPGYPPPGYPPPGYPPPGYAPPGYYPPPGYYAPPGYYSPQIAFGQAPRSLEYSEGEPVPPGYHVGSRPSKGLIIAGLCTFGGIWVASVAAASLLVEEEDGIAPLFIPVAGPFITIGTLESEGAGTFWLAANGVFQSAGVVLFIAGLVAEEPRLIRNDAQGERSLVPTVSVGPSAATARWQF